MIEKKFLPPTFFAYGRKIREILIIQYPTRQTRQKDIMVYQNKKFYLLLQTMIICGNG